MGKLGSVFQVIFNERVPLKQCQNVLPLIIECCDQSSQMLFCNRWTPKHWFDNSQGLKIADQPAWYELFWSNRSYDIQIEDCITSYYHWNDYTQCSVDMSLEYFGKQWQKRDWLIIAHVQLGTFTFVDWINLPSFQADGNQLLSIW